MKALITIITVIIVAIGIALLMAWPVELLWNWLMPEIFGLKTITFWQACGLNTLCSLLFKSHDNSSNKN